MTINDRLRHDTVLAARFCHLLHRLQENNDPRELELYSVYRRSQKGITDIEERLKVGHEAMFRYVESKYPDLYNFILTDQPELGIW